MHTVLRHLRRAALFSAGEALSDAQLLESFLSCRDEAAFELMMRRHGPMVLSVCKRILHQPQDVEDAFQATFLVLVRKAGSLRCRASLGSWLYGIAYRTAMKARTMNARRRARETAAQDRVPAGSPGETDEALLQHLDTALNALPEKYRAPLVLCELEGKTRKEAARLLGLTEGSLAWRLSQGKNLLARKLSRYVGVVSVGALTTALSEGAPVGVPRLLLTTTLAAARQLAVGGALTGVVSTSVLILTEGVIKAMLVSKLKLFGVVALVLSLGAGAGVSFRAGAAESPKTALNEVEALRADVEALRKLVLVTRERVQELEKEVETLKTPRSKVTAGADPRRVQSYTAPAEPIAPNPGMTSAAPVSPSAPQFRAMPQPGFKFSPVTPPPPQAIGTPGAAATFPGPSEGPYTPASPAPSGVPTDPAAGPPGTTPSARYPKPTQKALTEAEEALKQLHRNPNDRQAAEKLERAVQRLKEQTKPKEVQQH